MPSAKSPFAASLCRAFPKLAHEFVTPMLTGLVKKVENVREQRRLEEKLRQLRKRLDRQQARVQVGASA